MDSGQDIFLNELLIILLFGIILCASYFFKKSNDWIYLTFISYLICESTDIIPVFQNTLFNSSNSSVNENLSETIFAIQAIIWYLLILLMLDKTRKILLRIWIFISTISLLYFIFSMFFDYTNEPYQGILKYSSLLITIIALASSIISQQKNWAYNLTRTLFICTLPVYMLLWQLFPSLHISSAYNAIAILNIPLAFAVILCRYNSFWHETRRALQPTNRMNRKLAAQIIKSQEEERERIARDLHDQLGGTLAAVKMHIEANSGNDDWTVQTINLLNKASEDVRNIAHNLMPKDFERTNLETILQSFFYRLNIPGTMKFKFYSNPSPAQLPKQFQLILFRIILELVTNINKHSGATEASVQLIYHDAGLDLIVEDNGKGIQANTREGLGLKNIRSRVAFLQGKMVIDSTVAGTTTIINIPYK